MTPRCVIRSVPLIRTSQTHRRKAREERESSPPKRYVAKGARKVTGWADVRSRRLAVPIPQPPFLLGQGRHADGSPQRVGYQRAVIGFLRPRGVALLPILCAVNLRPPDGVQISVERRGGDPACLPVAQGGR